MRRTILALCLLLAGSARAAEEVRIGMILPLTGAAASTGLELRNAAELAAEIVNTPSGDFALPLAAGKGLPHLGGAKIRLIFADHQGNPQLGASEAERLITQEKVVALLGCYFSAVTATASQVAERHGIPFLTGESSSSTLTRRGFQWFFRTTPHDELFVQNFFAFLKDVEKKKGIKIKTLALLNENTLFGSETTKLEEKLAEENGYKVAEKILYPARSAQLTSEVQRIKAAAADVVMQSSYLGDAVLSIKTYKELGYAPSALLANDAGFNDSEFLKTVGKDAEYVLSREVWALDLAERKPLIRKVNDLMEKRHGVSFNGNSARDFTAVLVLAEAIDRAGSTAPEAIRKALRETNLPADQLIMPWEGIRFDATGQNDKGAGIIVQVQGGKYATVWPFPLASREIVWPMPDWSKR
ncbi:MAG TPA: ABC transporter substrate-binding protein [Myxococcales bacterium]|nr:ABC transporter substrate-binding protein [Myxococcales bacterium]